MFTATLTYRNMLSVSVKSVQVLIGEVTCNYPRINISNLGLKYQNATRLTMSSKMTVYVTVKLFCEYTTKTKFLWTIFKYNNSKLRQVRFNSNIKYGFDPYTQKNLVIKKKSLPYGRYMLKVTVTMADPKTTIFKASTRGYLVIYPSPLVAVIDGGALIRRGLGRVLKFKAEKLVRSRCRTKQFGRLI